MQWLKMWVLDMEVHVLNPAEFIINVFVYLLFHGVCSIGVFWSLDYAWFLLYNCVAVTLLFFKAIIGYYYDIQPLYIPIHFLSYSHTHSNDKLIVLNVNSVDIYQINSFYKLFICAKVWRIQAIL